MTVPRIFFCFLKIPRLFLSLYLVVRELLNSFLLCLSMIALLGGFLA